MKPQFGQQVKCFMNNGNMVEGIVESWDKEIILKSLDEKSLLIIHHPERDIILTKIVLDSIKEKEIVEKLPEIKREELPKNSDPMALRAKTLAQLRLTVKEADQKIISEKLTDHQPTQVKQTQYNYPSIIKKRE